jgi:uncharacterized protein
MHKSVLITVFVAAMVMFTQTSSAQNPDNAAFEAYSRGDYERDLRLKEPGIAQKDGAALWLRGLMHATGAGVDRNHVLAIEYLSAGVDAGATYGLTLIGNIYQEGGYGVAQDIAKAAQVYKTAADEGYADAQWLLGELYLTSNVVGIAPAKAAALFSKAALQEHPEALFSLGLLYQTGRGVEKNPAGAADLFNLSSIAGNSAAALRLAEMMDKGDSIPIDKDKAGFYYAIAAELGNTEAMPIAQSVRKSMNFRPVQQIDFEKRIDAWFREYGHRRVPQR